MHSSASKFWPGASSQELALKRILFAQRGWALGDQLTVSAGNFLTQLLLARSLPPNQYGTYAILISTILFLNNLHAGVVLLAIYVRCAGAVPAVARDNASAGIVLTTALGAFFALPAMIAAILLHRSDLILPVAFALIAWQAQETVRATLLSRVQHHRAVFGDGVSYIGQFVLLAVLARLSLLSLDRAFTVIGVTSLLAAAIQLGAIGYSRPRLAQIRDLCRHSLQIGRLAIPAKLASFFTLQSFPWTLELAGGATAAASFQALLNVLGVVNPLLIGTGSLVTASTAQSKTLAALKQARGHALFGMSAIVPWLLFVLIFPTVVLQLFYGQGSLYTLQTTPLRILVFGSLLEAIALPATCIMTGRSELRMFLVMQSLGALTFLGSCYFIFRLGVQGAALTFVAVQLARAAYGLHYYLKTKARSCEHSIAAMPGVVNV
jgi:O-antigen/teichoic acid export membrane protein